MPSAVVVSEILSVIAVCASLKVKADVEGSDRRTLLLITRVQDRCLTKLLPNELRCKCDAVQRWN